MILNMLGTLTSNVSCIDVCIMCALCVNKFTHNAHEYTHIHKTHMHTSTAQKKHNAKKNNTNIYTHIHKTHIHVHSTAAFSDTPKNTLLVRHTKEHTFTETHQKERIYT